MAFNALKHGNVSQIDWMFEGRVGFVAGFRLAIGEAIEVDRVLCGYGLENCCGPN